MADPFRQEAIYRALVPEAKIRPVTELPTYWEKVQEEIDRGKMIPLAPKGPDVQISDVPIVEPTDMASPEFLQATRPINDMEMIGGLAQTVDYFTGAPVRAALGSALQEGDNPLSAIKAGLTQFGRHPRQAPTGEQLATQMGITSRSLEDISPIFGGILARTPINKLAGFGIEAVADISPLAAMTLPGGRMFHGSPHYWKKADMSKVGTGEGAQAFGHGLYVTDSPKIAEEYARNIGKAKGKGVPQSHLYKGKNIELEKLNSGVYSPEEETAYMLKNAMERDGKSLDEAKTSAVSYLRDRSMRATTKKARKELNEEMNLIKSIKQDDFQIGNQLFYTTEIPKGEYLQWHETIDKDLRNKIIDDKVLGRLTYRSFPAEDWETMTGEKLYRILQDKMGSQKEASKALNKAGVTGIQYPAGTLSGVSDSKAMNYVLFNDKDLTVKEIKNLSTGKVERLGGIAKVGKLGNIIDDAKNYKSADEFIKAQGDLLYHSSDDVFKGGKPNFDAYFGTTDWKKSFTNEFGLNEYEVVLPKGKKILDLRSGSKDANTIVKKWGGDLEDFYGEDWVDKSKVFPEIKKLGYDGAVFDEEYILSENLINEIKTKAELTDIWKQSKEPRHKSL